MNKYLIILFLMLVGCAQFGCSNYQNDSADLEKDESSVQIQEKGKTSKKSVSSSIPAGRRMLPEDFSSSMRTGTTVVYFAKVSCPACKQQDKIWKRLVKKLPNNVKTDKRFTYAVNYRAYGVHQLPTIIVYKNGTEARRFIGVTKENNIISAAR